MADTELTSVLTDILVQAQDGQSDVKPEVAPFACDAFVFNEYSRTPAVILGPSGQNAHAPDEYVDLDSLRLLTQVYIEAIMQWCEQEQ